MLSAYRRFSAFFDTSAWLLILPALAVVWFVDAPMAITTLQWTCFAIIFAGVSIILSRIIFPQVRLGQLLDAAEAGGMPQAVVASALILFFGLLFLSMVLWSKT